MENTDPTFEEVHGPDVMQVALIDEKITPKYLAKKLKRALNAKETREKSLKGAMRQEDLPKGFKLIGVSGTLSYDKDDGEVFGDGNSLIQWNVIDWGTRERARMDTHKLSGHYPAAKHELSGSVSVMPKLSDEDRVIGKNITKQVINAIIDSHRRSDT